jgi:hypothetical protein
MISPFDRAFPWQDAARHSQGKTWESPEHLQDPAAITKLKYSGDSTAEALKQWGKANGSLLRPGACGMPRPANAASAEEFYQAVAARYADKSDANPSKGFGSNALKVNGKIFASLTRGRLLLKLPEKRVDALVESSKAARFSTGVGRVKKEWLTVGPSSKREWLALAKEARAYVGGQAK